MKKAILIYFSLFILLLSYSSRAEVNMLTGSFIYKKENPIQRIYRSRSLQTGFWGFGWCSILDEKLVFGPHKISYFDCLEGREKIVERPQISHKGEQIFVQIGAIRKIFNQKGWLIEVQDPEQRKISIQRAPEGFPLSLKRSGTTFSFTVKNFLIYKVVKKNKVISKYSYEKDLLVSSNLEKYKYDTASNLIEIKFENDTKLEISYEQGMDRVASVTDPFQCQKKYNYSSADDLSQSTILEWFCPGFKNFQTLKVTFPAPSAQRLISGERVL